MKNLFVLPTDKPSRLFVYDGKLGLAKESQYGSDAIQNQKIFITNEEKNKYGDWCIDLDSYFVFKFATVYKNKRVKKIILTTHNKLIEDGVQAIEDEFLDWFVNNPSCEEIGVEQLPLFKNPVYKTVIPKEEPKKDSVFSQLEVGKEYKQEVFELGKEPKQSIIKTKEDAKIFIEALENSPEPNEKLKKAFKDFHKQETTLEEVAEDFWLNDNSMTDDDRISYINGFITCAKWQQERMYSEEEVKILLVNIINEIEIRKQGIISKSETMPVHLLEGGCMAFESSIDVIKESFKKFKNK